MRRRDDERRERQAREARLSARRARSEMRAREQAQRTRAHARVQCARRGTAILPPSPCLPACRRHAWRARLFHITKCRRRTPAASPLCRRLSPPPSSVITPPLLFSRHRTTFYFSLLPNHVLFTPPPPYAAATNPHTPQPKYIEERRVCMHRQ